MPKKTGGKVAFTTNIDAELLQEFRVYCVVNNLYQNEVIEKLLRELLSKSKEGEREDGNSN